VTRSNHPVKRPRSVRSEARKRNMLKLFQRQNLVGLALCCAGTVNAMATVVLLDTSRDAASMVSGSSCKYWCQETVEPGSSRHRKFQSN
jgi:hypothetical protein